MLIHYAYKFIALAILIGSGGLHVQRAGDKSIIGTDMKSGFVGLAHLLPILYVLFH